MSNSTLELESHRSAISRNTSARKLLGVMKKLSFVYILSYRIAECSIHTKSFALRESQPLIPSPECSTPTGVGEYHPSIYIYIYIYVYILSWHMIIKSHRVRINVNLWYYSKILFNIHNKQQRKIVESCIFFLIIMLSNKDPVIFLITFPSLDKLALNF